jgi:hypothetical protein
MATTEKTMGIKRKRSETYVADTGKEFELEDMSPSHLTNVITHHHRQLEALTSVYNCTPEDQRGFLLARMTALSETINTLAGELATRDPDKDGEQGTSRWEDRNGY